MSVSAPSTAPLPPPPNNFGRPVAAPALKAGDDARAYAAKERAARIADEGRLSNDAAYYKALQTAVQNEVKREGAR